MPHLEPTFLRYIYDGLEKGELHPDNTAALPEGMTGLYEAAFDESKPARERQKLLKTFAVWALLKKEVSAQFVAEILEVPTQEIIDFIATYSSWFTSPESGKYQLYHERLKVFLLQKLSAKEIDTLHEKLIFRLEQAIDEQKEDEFELYGLEFLSYHLLVEGFVRKTGTKLLTFTKNNTVWDRQIQLSNKFEWSKKGLHYAASWTSKHDNEENIFCYLDLVELHHKEQNDAESIVRLVAENKIDLALERITAFGGPSKEQKERQFVLFMLCLIELTLLGSKNKTWRKEAIEKLLKHLESEIPVDYSLVNWNNFFPSYLMFQIVIEIKFIELEFIEIYKRTDTWDSSWIKTNSSLSDLHINVLIEITNSILDNYYRCFPLTRIALTLNNRGNIKNARSFMLLAFETANNIPGSIDRYNAMIYIIPNMIKFGLMKQVFKIAKELSDASCFNNIASELIKIGNIKKAEKTINRALVILKHIPSDSNKFIVIKNITCNLIKIGHQKEALKIAKTIPDVYYQSLVISEILLELMKIEEFPILFEITKSISNDYFRSCSLIEIASQFEKKGDIKHSIILIKEALDSSKHISNNYYLNSILPDLSSLLKKTNQIEQSEEILKQAIDVAKNISNYSEKCSSLSYMALELVKREKYEKSAELIQQSLEVVNLISDKSEKSDQIVNIIERLILIGKGEINNQLIDKITELVINIGDKRDYYRLLTQTKILEKIAEEGRIENFIRFSHNYLKIKKGLSTDFQLYNIREIAMNISKNISLHNALVITNTIKDKFQRSITLNNIALNNKNNDNKKLSEKLIQESLISALNISDEFYKNIALKSITINYIKMGYLKQAKRVLKYILDNKSKVDVLIEISSIYYGIGEDKKAEIYFQQAYNIANNVMQKEDSLIILIDLAYNLIKVNQNKLAEKIINETLILSNNISNKYERSNALSEISSLLFKIGQIEYADKIINEAIEIAQTIEEDTILTEIIPKLIPMGKLKKALDIALNIPYYKSLALQKILSELIRLKDYEFAYDNIKSIDEMYYRNEIWCKIGESQFKNIGLDFCILKLKEINNLQARMSFKKGIVQTIDSYGANLKTIGPLLILIKEDSESIEHLLNMHSLNNLFFQKDYPQEKMEHFNKVLNLQWAIDIKNQLPN